MTDVHICFHWWPTLVDSTEADLIWVDVDPGITLSQKSLACMHCQGRDRGGLAEGEAPHPYLLLE
jgi:hypothetical protein